MQKMHKRERKIIKTTTWVINKWISGLPYLNSTHYFHFIVLISAIQVSYVLYMRSNILRRRLHFSNLFILCMPPTRNAYWFDICLQNNLTSLSKGRKKYWKFPRVVIEMRFQLHYRSSDNNKIIQFSYTTLVLYSTWVIYFLQKIPALLNNIKTWTTIHISIRR